MIEMHDVAFRHPGAAHDVLSELTLRFDAGERVVVLGGNGSGKTTLLRLCNGTLRPTHGSVRVEGRDTRDPEHDFTVRRRVGLLFQEPDNQFVTTTVEREIAFGLENLAVPTPALRARVDAALQRFDLERYREVAPHEMSGGEKARLALACVWVMEPAALLLDETASLLDRPGRERLRALVAALPPETAVIESTTDAEIAATAARVLVLDGGRCVADGPPDAVFAALPPRLRDRLGVPLAWEVSSRLALRHPGVRPTVSWEALQEAVGPRPADPGNRAVAAPAAGGAAAVRDSTGRLLVALRGASVVYQAGLPQEVRALDEVSVEVRAGDRVGILGCSGSGKSTLLDAIAGLQAPDTGRREVPEGGVRVPSYVFQFPERQLFAETVFEEVAYGLRESGLEAGAVRERVEAALDIVGLPPARFAAQPPWHLSFGEKRRVALATAVAQQRRLVLLDEPTLGLDHEGVERLQHVVTRLHAAGHASWIVSHDAAFLLRTCDHLMVLQGGRIVAAGSPEQVFSSAAAAAAWGIARPPIVEAADSLRQAGWEGLAACPTLDALVEVLGAAGTPRAQP